MGQKVSPVGLRIGVNKTWDSRWFAEKKDYVEWLHQDIQIRNALMKLLKHSLVSKIEIERTKKEIVIFIKTARPGMVLGQEGKNIENLIKAVRKVIKLNVNNSNLMQQIWLKNNGRTIDNKTNKKMVDIKINVVEIKNPDLDAQLIANTIADQIVNRASFRTVQKLAIKKALRSGAKGIKTSVSGRLGGVDMARVEGYLEGNVPLATLRSDIDYALAEALTTYGQIGVKVWICKGEILPEQNNHLNNNNNVSNNNKQQSTPVIKTESTNKETVKEDK